MSAASSFPFSVLGQQLSAESGIELLMEDLGQALATGGSNVKMLGGGNPAAIAEVTELWRTLMRELLDEDPDRFDRMLVNYDPSRGNPGFLAALADFFQRQFGWDITPDNIAITNGGQTAFFFLFNLLAGPHACGVAKHILFPLVPEYIGYANQSLTPDMFRACVPQVESIDQTTFKYRVDFDALEIRDTTAALCISRPTNPTGNVLDDAEVERLRALAVNHGIPLILDNAYGAPFPGIVFREVTPPWGENVILTFSLSKLGLPGTRTGIVVGPPPSRGPSPR